MPVTTTAQQILEAAYARSLKNKPGEIATEATELLDTVTRALRGLYAAAARINPIHFAKTATVPFAGPPIGGWTRPDDAESIFRLEGTGALAGTEIRVVPFDDTGAEAKIGRPAVYQLGRVFYPAGNDADPTGGDLVFFYAQRPGTPATLAATLDPSWDETFNEVLILEVAIYLAMKDGRADEVQMLTAARDRWLPLFVAHLEHATANERRRIGHVRRFPVSTILPLLAGATSDVGTTA